MVQHIKIKNTPGQRGIGNGSYLKVVPSPRHSSANGKEGNIAFDDQYFYTYSKGKWCRVAIAEY